MTEAEKANARLIASAPELLEALLNTSSLLRAFAGPDDSIAQAALRQVDIAIAKAKGE